MSRLNQIQPAIRTGQKARIALSGPTGGGKTWTALVIATELAGPDGTVLVIDTERGSAALYSDAFKFDTIDWTPPYDPREVAETIREAAERYDAIVVDSLTHFWQGEGGTLDIVESSASRSAGGNKFAGWKVGTPAQNSFVEAMLQADAHVIATMRSKMEHVLETGPNGKQVPRKVGMAPVQRDGIEYEFTVGAELDLDHRLTISKSRCAEVADQMYQGHQAKDMAATIKHWLEAAPAVNLWPEILRTVPSKEAREKLAKEWAEEFDFKTTAVPVEREEEARNLISTYVVIADETAPAEAVSE